MKFEDKNFIAKKIKLARKKENLTQAELAEKIGISAKQLSRIEMASFVPSLMTFLSILQVLQMDISEFGVLVEKKESNTKKKLIKLINSASDDELELYASIIEVLDKKNIK